MTLAMARGDAGGNVGSMGEAQGDRKQCPELGPEEEELVGLAVVARLGG